MSDDQERHGISVKLMSTVGGKTSLGVWGKMPKSQGKRNTTEHCDLQISHSYIHNFICSTIQDISQYNN